LTDHFRPALLQGRQSTSSKHVLQSAPASYLLFVRAASRKVDVRCHGDWRIWQVMSKDPHSPRSEECLLALGAAALYILTIQQHDRTYSILVYPGSRSFMSNAHHDSKLRVGYSLTRRTEAKQPPARLLLAGPSWGRLQLVKQHMNDWATSHWVSGHTADIILGPNRHVAPSGLRRDLEASS
jgi:hypothetical protein